MSELWALGIAGTLCSHKMRTAARMLPSSSLELTAVIRASDRRGRTSGVDPDGWSVPHPAGSLTHVSTRPLMMLAKLRLWPALGGLAKMKGAKPNSALQLSKDPGVAHVFRRAETRAWEHDARAPLQMCLRMGPWQTGCGKVCAWVPGSNWEEAPARPSAMLDSGNSGSAGAGVSVSKASTNTSGISGVAAVPGPLPGPKGGRFEPGQGLPLGPCK